MAAFQPAWAGWVGAAWVLGATAALRAGSPGWAAWPAGLRLALGLWVLLPAAWALVAWKGLGLNALLSVFCLVWAADVMAYAAGRLWGRRKLAPAISPGKSWEGVAGGVLGVFAVAALWLSVIDPWLASAHGLSLYGRLVAAWGWPIAALALMVLTALSVVGDLVESLIKRAAGAKDSSRLLPGHGGVLDRIDALLPVLPAALGLLAWVPGAAA
jgi:phosphatidate cytidylyltransferase